MKIVFTLDVKINQYCSDAQYFRMGTKEAVAYTGYEGNRFYVTILYYDYSISKQAVQMASKARTIHGAERLIKKFLTTKI